jgi:deoxycytidylate deaminase
MPVKIHNKEYTTVAERISQFRELHKDYSLTSEILSNADLVVVKAVIADEAGRVLATGHAEEVRGSTNINKTSALENCETSAWGRALAALNFGGDQVASANEVSDAIIKQQVMEATERYIRLGKAVQDNIESIHAIKQYMASGELESAVEAFTEMTDDDKQALNIAPTKGGVWTVEEYKTFKSNEWNAARKAYFGGEQ